MHTSNKGNDRKHCNCSFCRLYNGLHIKKEVRKASTRKIRHTERKLMHNMLITETYDDYTTIMFSHPHTI